MAAPPRGPGLGQLENQKSFQLSSYHNAQDQIGKLKKCLVICTSQCRQTRVENKKIFELSAHHKKGRLELKIRKFSSSLLITTEQTSVEKQKIFQLSVHLKAIDQSGKLEKKFQLSTHHNAMGDIRKFSSCLYITIQLSNRILLLYLNAP